MAKLPSNVIQFAKGDVSLYDSAVDYYNHFATETMGKKLPYMKFNSKGEEIPLTEKEATLNAAILRKIGEYSFIPNFNLNDFPLQTWASHPGLNWAAFAVITNIIEAILPVALVDSVGVYTDVRTIGYGDSAAFNIEPRDLFMVSQSGRGMRQGEIKRQMPGQVVLNPVQHEMTVGVSLYRVLAGEESLARFAMKAVASLEDQMSRDAYSAFATAMDALPTTAGNAQLKATGWSQDTFVNFAQKVTAWNGGNKAVLIGTQRALAQVLPDNANFRFDLESDYVKVGFIKDFAGYSVLGLPQIADWSSATPFGLILDDTKLWIVSPSAQKLIKLVLEGSTMSYASGPFDAATLIQTNTFYKSWIAGIATNSIAAEIALS